VNELKGNNPMFNASGCKDPTAGEAIIHMSKEEHELNQKVHTLVKLTKELINFAGFELVGRIQIKDKRTGKEFR
jgi:hypothetical protein